MEDLQYSTLTTVASGSISQSTENASLSTCKPGASGHVQANQQKAVVAATAMRTFDFKEHKFSVSKPCNHTATRALKPNVNIHATAARTTTISLLLNGMLAHHQQVKFHPHTRESMHALKGLACAARVTPASSQACSGKAR